MNDRTRSGLRDSLLVIVGLIVVFVASVAVGSRISWLGEWLRDSPSIAGEVHNVPAVAVPAHRRLTPSMRALVNDILEDDETLLVVLNAEDLVGCEDLGRQVYSCDSGCHGRRPSRPNCSGRHASIQS